METNLQIGAGSVEITPSPRTLTGSAPTGTLRPGSPLLAGALVFDDGHSAAALVGVDLCVLGEDTVDRVRALVAQTTSIPGENVLLAASHTHSGPPVTPWLAATLDTEYVSWMQDRVADAVVRAWEARRPARVGVGRGMTDLAVNRWVETPQGAHWGVAWDGPTDNSVTVLRADSPDGTPVAAMTNFAAHASVMAFGSRDRYSADFPGFVREYLERQYPGLSAVFTNGASGDLKVAFVDDEGTQFRYGDVQDARRYGYQIGEEARRVIERTRTSPVDEVCVASTWCDLPIGEPPSEEEVLRELSEPEYPRYGNRWAQEMLGRIHAGTLQRSFRAEVQAIRLGDTATLLALPGEAFAEIGLRLKQELGPRYPGLFVIAYANSYAGYLPSRRSILLDADRPRYNWHKFVGTPAVYTEEMEDVLVGAAHVALAGTLRTPEPACGRCSAAVHT